jgi:hypothetical protein
MAFSFVEVRVVSECAFFNGRKIDVAVSEPTPASSTLRRDIVPVFMAHFSFGLFGLPVDG